jgi:ABC-type phosphate/phosphonate transport system permease subunit
MSSHRRITRTFGVIIAGVCAALFAVYGLAEGIFRNREANSLLQYAAAFACFGFMFGAILAFDTEPGDRHENRPALRTLLSAMAGMAFGWVLHFPIEGVALSALGAAALGYVGLIWAKHV